MKKPKVYFAVNLIMESENPHLIKINKEILPKYADIIPWFGTGPVDDMRTLYNMDIKAVESADIVIAEVSYPSHGVGMEVMHAIHIGKPVLAIALKGQIVSRMLRGIDYDKFQFKWYKDFPDLENILESYFEDFKLS
jgi:nucleoside 2-deoxyribosyltransferase